MLEIRNLSKRFGKKQVIDNLNVTVPSNGVYIIVGTNGCGKTTFMNMVTNLLKPDSGTIICEGHDVGTKGYKKSIFYIPSDFYLPEYLTANEYLQMMLAYYPKASMEQVDFLFKVLDLEDSRYQLLETFSFGMKKKIQLLTAIAAGTDYVFADELFGGLDFDTVILVQELLKELQLTRTFVIVSHDLNTLLSFPQNIYIMSCGKLSKFEGRVEMITEAIKSTGGLDEKLQHIRQQFSSHQIIS